jgi:hypothetical protein
MLDRGFGRRLHFLGAERAVAAGAAEQADAVNLVFDLEVDGLVQTILIDRLVVALGGCRHEREYAGPEIVLSSHQLPPMSSSGVVSRFELACVSATAGAGIARVRRDL